MTEVRTVTSLAVILLLVAPVTAAAEEPDIEGRAGSDVYEIIGEQANDATRGDTTPTSDTAPTSGGDSQGAPAFVDYRWLSVCTVPGSGAGSGFAANELDCNAARVCPEPGQLLFRLWGRTDRPDAWVPLSTSCFNDPPTPAQTPRPQVTAALVLNEIRRIGLPMLQARTQPEGKTLVNFETIFYTEAQPFNATVTLLGQRVDIVAEPAEYTWHHGDGSTTTTDSPGAPYPSRDITYTYSDANTTVSPRVDVTYAAQFRVNGGAWQDIPETVTIEGPATSLEIAEARAALSGNYGP